MKNYGLEKNTLRLVYGTGNRSITSGTHEEAKWLTGTPSDI